MVVHFYNGCSWASGDLQGFDTDQTLVWQEVTCKKCKFGNSDYSFLKHNGWNKKLQRPTISYLKLRWGKDFKENFGKYYGNKIL